MRTVKPFSIDHYYRGVKVIDVYITNRDNPLHIDREEFESWLDNTERLEFITDVVADHNGEPKGGITGKMTLAEFWDSEWDVITNDIIEFIIYHQPASFFDLKKSIDKVTSNSHVHPTVMTAISKLL